MKKDIFAKTYDRVQLLKKAFEKAETETERESLRSTWKSLMDNLEAHGKIARKIWREYESSMDCGNQYLDIHDLVDAQDVAPMVACLKETGIEYFTFSSDWSSVETAWLFKENGCHLEGLVEINSRHRAFMSTEYEKAHAFLFKI